MNWKSLIFAVTFAAMTAPAALADDAADIRKTLEDQVADWNRGDIHKFVSVYTEDSVFVGSEIQRGQKQVLERYLKRYPNKEAMGKTTFSNLEIKLLAGGYASVIGNWKLERSQQAGGNIGGIFTLLLRKSGKQWKIILDHTS